MKPAVVVDVGNTRVKWGRCADDRVIEMASLAHDDEAGWRRQLADWQIPAGSIWAVSGVQPAQRDRLCAWLVGLGQKTLVINSYRQLPLLRIDVDYPEKVGLDRLLNAVAVNSVRSADSGAFIVDAGTAVTVDYVDALGTFQGGAIFPGLRLMAKALHDYTAMLPLIDDFQATSYPATNTEDALRTGIVQAVVGGIDRLAPPLTWCDIFLGGGDAALLAPHLSPRRLRLWPEMTLDGIRRSVQYRTVQ